MLQIFKKKNLLIFSFIVVIALLFPLSFAQAQWWKIFTAIPSLIFTLLFELLLLLGQGALKISNFLLAWIITEPFQELSMTDPARNPIIQVGWVLLRDISNMLFILGLAYIGLATALNIAGFQTKKVFFRLLLIALVINFTPVFTGVIVDVSNILARFFLKGVNFDAILDNYKFLRGEVFRNWDNLLTDPATLTNAVILIIYGGVASIIFLLFAILLLFRHPAIWILVILSPAAFFAWIFPETRKFYNRWWNWFFQWATIVIPASFMLYISQHILANTDKFSTYAGDPTGGFFPKVAPYLMAVFFLILGFFMALSITAIGSGAIIKLSKKAGGMAMGAAGFVGVKGAEGARNILRRRVEPGKKPGEEGYEKWAKEHKARARMGRIGRFVLGGLTETEKEKMGKLGKAVHMVARGAAAAATGGAPLWVRPLARKAASLMEEDTERKINQAQNKTKGKPLATQRANLKNAVAASTMIGTLQAIAEDGNIEDLGISREEIKKIIKKALKVSPASVARTLRFIDPAITQELAREMKLSPRVLKEAGVYFGDEDRKKGFKNLYDKLIATMKPGKMGSMTKEAATKAAESEAAQRFWTGAHIAKGADLFGATFLEAVQRGMQSATGTDNREGQEKWYKEHNRHLFNYFRGTAAQNLGISLGAPSVKPAVSEEELERFRREYAQPWEKKKKAKEEKIEGAPQGEKDTGETKARERKKPDVGERDTGEAKKRKRKKPDVGAP